MPFFAPLQPPKSLPSNTTPHQPRFAIPENETPKSPPNKAQMAPAPKTSEWILSALTVKASKACRPACMNGTGPQR